MIEGRPFEFATPDAAVNAAQWVAGGASIGLLALTAATELFDVRGQAGFLVFPAGLVGLVSIVFGFRLFELRRSRLATDASAAVRRRSFFLATVAALTVTEASGLFGVIVYLFSGHPLALVGVLTHIILVGAIWPSNERLDAFVGS